MNYLKLKLRKQFYLQKQPREYRGINLTEELQNLFSENYNTFRKDIKYNLNKWENICGRK